VEEIKKQFKNKDLYDLALTHRSWVNENKKVRRSNERLEFLGDAVLEYVVSSFLYKELADKEEGFLTALRANIVNTKNLSEFADSMKMGEELYLSKGEEASGGRTNPSLLADTVESIIGAIYIDRGLKAAEEFIHKNLLTDLDKKLAEPLKDPKSRFQEGVQAKGYPTPKYRVVNEEGPDHAKEFTVEVTVDKKVIAQGKGNSKSAAEQDAAERALDEIDQEL